MPIERARVFVRRRKQTRALLRRNKNVTSSHIMTNRTPRITKQPVSPTFLTKLYTSYTCIYPPNTAISDYTDIICNGAYTPFATMTANFRTAINGETAYNVKNPTGFTSICGSTSVYKQFHVLGFSLKTTLLNNEAMILACVPMINSYTLPTTYSTMEQTMFSKCKSVDVASSESTRSLSIRASCPKFFGVSKASYLTSSYAGNYGGDPSGTEALYTRVMFHTATNANNTTSFMIKFELCQTVLFSDNSNVAV